MRGSAFSRYEQFETSPEATEQELRSAVCELLQTDLRRIIVQIIGVLPTLLCATAGVRVGLWLDLELGLDVQLTNCFSSQQLPM